MLILALGVEGIHQEPRRALLCWVLRGLLVGLGSS